MKLFLLLFAALVASASPARRGPEKTAADDGEDAVVERRLAVMGTLLEARIEGPRRADALAASEVALRAIQTAEARLSTWRSDSELSRLNRTEPNAPSTLSPELARDLERVAVHWRSTEGAFDPGLGSLVAAWGLRRGGRVPSDDELDLALSSGGFSALRLEGLIAVRSHPRLLLEEGGFGKGIALDAAVQALVARGTRRALLDLGGQIAVVPGEQPYRIAVADPRDRSRPVAELTVERGSVATTANSERGIEVDGRRYAHVLDPRSGRPVDDFGSLTVWASDATAADCLSTGLYVLGPARALSWAERHADIEVLVLEVRAGELHARCTPGFSARLRSLVEDLSVSRDDP